MSAGLFTLACQLVVLGVLGWTNYNLSRIRRSQREMEQLYGVYRREIETLRARVVVLEATMWARQ